MNFEELTQKAIEKRISRELVESYLDTSDGETVTAAHADLHHLKGEGSTPFEALRDLALKLADHYGYYGDQT